MQYQYLKIDPQLEEYARSALVFDNSRDSGSSDLPLFTNGMSALLCKSCNTSNLITLFGQSVPDEKWVVENNTTLIAFFFKPFVFGPIFKLSAKEQKEKNLELNLWNAQKAMAIHVQLFHASSMQEKVEIISHFIRTQIQSNLRECEIVRQATDTIMHNSNTDVLSQLLKDLNLTERTFQRVFKKYIGITANEYRRTCQFYFALSQLKGGHFDKLADVAYENGYFDQSHYIRSFKEFTQITPNEYLQSGLNKRDNE